MLVKLSGLGGGEIKSPAVLSLEWDVGRKVRGLERERIGDRGDSSAGAGAWLLMEWIEGKSVKDLLREWDTWVKGVKDEEEKRKGEEEVKMLLRRIGRAVGALHSKGGVVHGDLTSSNIMVRPTGQEQMNRQDNGGERGGERMPDLHGEIVLIDFGLATQSVQDEDRAVDLYVLERAFGSTHPRQEGWFDEEVLQSQEGYRGGFKGASVVLKRLEEVRMRGRKRSMIG